MGKVIVFGAGLSGIGAKQLLEKNGFDVYLIDDKIGISSKEGIKILNNEDIEFIVKSPGISWQVELLKVAKEKGIKVISEIDLAYKYMNKSIKIISITGTNGKTTTATKIFELLEFAGKKVKLAGNAGFSFAKLVADEEDLEYVVLELSSYQLENNPQIHSNIAGIINLTPDHLARYKNVEEYYITKFNIFKKQSEKDFALINLDDKEFLNLYENKNLKEKIKGRKIYLSKKKKGNVFVDNGSIFVMKNLENTIETTNEITENIAEKIIDVRDLALKGIHNLENMLFIISVGKILEIENEKIVQFLKTTKALEHRLENFYVKDNTVFINDSKGTNVESTLKAIDSFENKIILILGGDDKKVSNKELVKKIKKKVSFVYLIGVNASILINDMEKIGYKNYKNLETLENVINYLQEKEDFTEDKTILLSPATSSWCQFKNFEHRGNTFKKLVLDIIK